MTNDQAYQQLKQEIEQLKQEKQQLLSQVQSLKKNTVQPRRLTQEKTLLTVITKIRQSLDLRTIFKATATELRQFLQADRVGIFKFDENSHDQAGEMIAEDVVAPYKSALMVKIQDHCFAQDYSRQYEQGKVHLISNVDQAPLEACYRELLNRFQVKSNLVVPLLKNQELWGLLCIHQCSQPRQWESGEIAFVKHIGVHLCLAIQQAEMLRKSQQQALELQFTVAQVKQQKREQELATARERILARVIDKIRQTLDLETIFITTAKEVRELLMVDRVAVFKFLEGSHFHRGEFMSESVVPQYSSAINTPIIDDCFGQQYAQYYQEGRIQALVDVDQASISDCHRVILKQFQVKANLVVPILTNQQLWGLLCIHHCRSAREWTLAEINFIKQIASQMGVALIQARQLQKLQEKSQELMASVQREKAIAKIINKIRRSLDLNTIFATTTQEVRNLLQADRVAIYKFNQDWSGEFIIDSVGEEWSSLVQKQESDPEIKKNINNCTVQHLANPQFTDSYLQRHHGDLFSDHDLYRVCHNIAEGNFSPCYIQVLEKYQAKAYIIVAIYRGQELWGLLAAYQNSAPRHWQDSEIKFLVQIGANLSVAIQQAKLLQTAQVRSEQLQTTLTEQLQNRAEELIEEAEREKGLAQVIDKIRQTLDIETIFQTATTEARHLLQADRVAVFQFLDGDYVEGKFISEDVSPQYLSALGLKVIDQCFADYGVTGYTQGKMQIIPDIYQANFSQCHLELLERFDIRANLVIPIIKNENLWGLFCIHQCSAPRHWQEKEVEFLAKIAVQLDVALQQTELLSQAQNRSQQLQLALGEVQAQKEQEQALNRVIDKIRQSLELETIFQTSVTEVRQLLQADRVAIFQFDLASDYHSGQFVCEEVLSEFDSAYHAQVTDHCFGENYAQYYEQKRLFYADNIYTHRLQACHVKILERFQVKANMVAPLIKGGYLWGLLCIHQCSAPRHWQEREQEFIAKIAVQLGVALQQAELLAQAQQRSQELRTALADLTAIMDNLADGLLVIDIQGKITRFNPVLLTMFDLETVDLEGAHFSLYFPSTLTDLVAQAERSSEDVVTANVELPHHRIGQAQATSILKEAHGNEGNQCLGSVILVRDVTVEREVDRIKTDFLATVSHELRTPLTSVLGFASIIEEKLQNIVFPALDPNPSSKVSKSVKRVQGNIQIIISEAERLTALINDVLDIAKMESGKIDWTFTLTQPTAILNRAIAAISSLLHGSDIRLIQNLQSNLPQVRVDCDRIIQVLINLLSNAIKFTEKGDIICEIKATSQLLIVTVKDTGIGIDPQNHDKIFQRFGQVGDVLTDKPKGTGLGLPICKQIIEYHGGEIWVDSQLGQGSTFTFTIPLQYDTISQHQTFMQPSIPSPE